MGNRASDNLQLYLTNATLPFMSVGEGTPPLPPFGHKSHRNNLQVRPEKTRRLELMLHIEELQFKRSVQEYICEYIPSHALGVDDLDKLAREDITVPCQLFDILLSERDNTSPGDMYEFFRWLDIFPLGTAKRVMHLVYPETKAWKVFLGERDVDESMFQHSMWGLRPTNPLPNGAQSRNSLVIAFQPPWILSPQDLKCFVECTYMPSIATDSDARYDSEHRIWAKLSDLCLSKHCPWFVLSTCWGWVFGAFSNGWTRAFVSPIISFDSEEPTVLSCLVYWFASSTGLPGTWKIPKVGDEPLAIPSEFICDVFDVMHCDAKAALALALLT
ncbi:hypothetical protein JAAARDRAFT_55585 [Jaapia argillacea MUCL 33604]|uniref:Uncharacterized protein n=1 Tax=Jaapia argillacea MUCL 33604 TaxID=933084 RepID=A0A067QBF5_9AGAM|nr:hypothetical protein JAAARDRAFT_55585 [Jaapia argillacea MUCL 33604]